MGLAKGISNCQALEALADHNLFVKDRFQSESKECETYLVARGHPDGPLAVLKLRLKRSNQTYGEINHWNRVDHLHCLKLYETLPIGNRIGHVTDFCANGTIASWVVKNKNSIKHDALQKLFMVWTKQLLLALTHLQGIGLFHLNVCPDALMLDEHLKLKLGGMSAIRTSRGRFLAFVKENYQPLDVLFTEKRNTDFDKLHTWTAAASLLESFTGYYIGGYHFQPGTPKLIQQQKNILENVKHLRSLPGLCDDLRSLFALMLVPELSNRPKMDVVMAVVHHWPNTLTDKRSVCVSSEVEAYNDIKYYRDESLENQVEDQHVLASPCVVATSIKGCWSKLNDLWQMVHWASKAENSNIGKYGIEEKAKDLEVALNNLKRKIEENGTENAKRTRKEGCSEYCVYCKHEPKHSSPKQISLEDKSTMFERILNKNIIPSSTSSFSHEGQVISGDSLATCSSFEEEPEKEEQEKWRNQSIQCKMFNLAPMDIE